MCMCHATRTLTLTLTVENMFISLAATIESAWPIPEDAGRKINRNFSFNVGGVIRFLVFHCAVKALPVYLDRRIPQPFLYGFQLACTPHPRGPREPNTSLSRWLGHSFVATQRVLVRQFMTHRCWRKCIGRMHRQSAHEEPKHKGHFVAQSLGYEPAARIFRRILQSEILSHPTRKTHCMMNEISRKFPEFARSVKKGLGGEGASRHGASEVGNGC